MGPTLASPRGQIGDVIFHCDWPACAWTSWPLVVAVVGLHFSFIVFLIVWRDLLFAFRMACIGRLRLEAETGVPRVHCVHISPRAGTE